MCTFCSLKDEDHSKRRPWACKISPKNKRKYTKKSFFALLLNIVVGLNILVYFYPRYINAISKTNSLFFENSQDEYTFLKSNNFKLIKTNSSPPVLGFENFENLNDFKILPKKPNNLKEKYVWITAYSSTPEETDDTPHLTASGTPTREGIIATNLLPFRTKIKIPEIFGDKIFIVEDRMHERKTNFIDIWMPSKEEAIKFGIHYSKILILEENSDFAQK